MIIDFKKTEKELYPFKFCTPAHITMSQKLLPDWSGLRGRRAMNLTLEQPCIQ